MYELIKEELDKKGKSFYWLSKKTGIPDGLFAMMKKRGSDLNAANLYKVAKALRKPMEKFVRKEE